MGFCQDKGNVKVTIIQFYGNGKTVYKKKFKNSYLYIFRNGQIQVGRPNFDKLAISPSKEHDGTYVGVIKEKEEVY